MSFPRYEAYRDSGVEWLGEVPKHWRCDPISALTTSNDEVLTETTPPDYEMQYVEISDVEHGLGICGSSTVLFAEAPSRARRRVKDGDVIVSTVRTYLKAIAPVIRPPENLVVSTGFAVIRPRSIHSGFLGYLIASNYVIAEVISRSVGVSYPAINASEIMRIKVTVPPTNEQEAIAAFLDRETSKIDALVAEQVRLIELLKEKRQAVISHAVTKGLDPNAPMKDSGVEWLGEVPAHWKVLPFRWLISRIESGTSVNAIDIPATAGELGVLKTSCVYTGEFDPAENKAVVEAERSRVSCPLTKNTIIISRMNTPALVGAAGLVMHTQENLFLPDRLWQVHIQEEYPAFVYWWTTSAGYRTQVRLACSGTSSSMQNIAQDQLLAFKIALPLAKEQLSIIQALDDATAKFKSLLAEAEAAIALLQERRSALISAAVTGKIDVRGLATAEAEAA